MKPRLQIIRGLPGSGKSTYARKRWPHLLMLEFDQFCHHCGHYTWNPSINENGQGWLDAMIDATLAEGFDFVVCGVFAGNAECLQSVVERATAYGYEVWIETLTADHGNTHGVRECDLTEMRRTFVADSDLDFGDAVRFGSMPSEVVVDPVQEG